jgi:UDP-N-acetylmuramyl pentapeptide phosphotransferase/UDP-N-acetylglucosamine-1-phosphate transferase
VLNVIYFTALACLFIQLSRMLALRHNVLLDVPNGRKQHHAATPCTGGVGIVIAALAGVALQQASVFQQEPWYFLGLGAIFVLGVLDDLMGLSPKTKLLVELPLISTVLLFFSQYPSFESEHLLPIFWAKWFGVGFAIFLMLGFINALNMTDGVDGLAGFLSLYYAAVCAGLAAALEQTVITYLALGLVGSLIGFLLFNFRTPFGRKALVFLGDSGSMALGFALGWLGLALHDLNTVTDTALVLLVTSLELHGTLQDLLVQGVLHAILNGNHDGLIHLVGHDDADAGLSQITFFHRLTSLLLLSQNGHHASDVLLDCFDAAGVLQLVDGMLEAQVKQLGLQVCQLAGQLCGLHFAEFISLHWCHPPSRSPHGQQICT